MKYVLLNEFPGESFGIETSKKEYGKNEDVWTTIHAPSDSDVELSFNYDGYRQYIKIPKEKGYPLDFLLPIPNNIKQGIYVIRAAVYYAGLIMKTDTYFEINEDTIRILGPEREEPVSAEIGSQEEYEPAILPPEKNTEDITDNRSIKVALDYGTASEYDEDNDGIESKDGIIDLTAKSTKFSWEANEDKLCSQWAVESLDTTSVSKVCYGSQQCCDFISLKPSKQRWNDDLYLNYGSLGATKNNLVSVRVIHVDYDVGLENPYSNIVYSDVAKISANFEEVEDKKSNLKNQPIVVDEEVKWSKEVEVENAAEKKIDIDLLVDIPATARGIRVIEGESGEIVANYLSGNDLVIRDSLDSNENKEYVIEFETAPPRKEEKQPLESGTEWKKEVVITSDSEYEGDYEYKNVLSYSDIKESEKENIRLYWDTDSGKVDVTDAAEFNVSYYDTNNNGLMDRISWITPHLSTQEFEIVITLTATASPFEEDISIILTEPRGGIHMNENPLGFRFSVTYNDSYTNVVCNLSVDSAVIKRNIPTVTSQSSVWTNLSEGLHSWYVECGGDDSVSSTTEEFIVDITPPAIELLNDDPDLSLVDSIDLKFRAADNIADDLDCSLLINGELNKTDIAVSSGIEATVNVNALENGTYNWAVRCQDEAGNLNTSLTGNFYIDTKKNFSIRLDKEDYSLGEGGVYIITAPHQAEVTMVITTPKETTITRSYSGDFPVIDQIDFLEYPGTYELKGFLNYGGAIKTDAVYLNAKNTLSAEIKVDKHKVKSGTPIQFKGTASGGIGDLSYEWDLGDGSTSTEKTFSHSYSEIDTYRADLYVTDSKGNSIRTSRNIYVEQDYEVKVYVRDAETGEAVENAKVYLEGEEQKTDSSGLVSYTVFKDEYSLLVRHDDYLSFFNTTLITGATELMVELSKLTGNLTAEDLNLTIPEEPEEKESEITEIAEEPVEEPEREFASSLDLNIDQLIAQAEQAVYAYNDLDSQGKEFFTILDMQRKLEKAEKSLRRYKADLFNLESKARADKEEEIAERKKEINENVNDIYENTVVSVDVRSHDEYISYPNEEIIRQLSIDYLDAKNISMSEKQIEQFIKNNMKIQKQLSMETVVKTGEIQFLSGKKQDVTLVAHLTGNDTSEHPIVVSIPKSIAEDIGQMEIINDHEIVNSDPMIEFRLEETDKIVYYINAAMDTEKTKEIQAVLMSSPSEVKVRNAGLSIIGYAIFSRITGIENPLIIFEILAIVILLAVYLEYQFDLKDKIKGKLLCANKELRQVTDLMNDIKVCLENNEIDNASVVYSDLMKEYRKLSPKAKASIHKKIIDIYSQIAFYKLNEKINMAFALVKEKELGKAKANYSEIKEIYKGLPEDYKLQVTARCRLLFEKLA